MLVVNMPLKALMFLTLMRPSLVLFLVLWLRLVRFFFSSRRRHTRYIGDWSSDVCSSDLVDARIVSGYHWTMGLWDGDIPASQMVNLSAGYRINPHLRVFANATNLFDQQHFRSEERRVGKECRSRCAPPQL